MHFDVFALLNFNQNGESGWGFALQNRFLGAPPSRFVIRERYGRNTANQIGKGWIDQKIVQRITVSRAHQLDAAFGNRSGSLGFEFAANFVNHNHFRVVVFNRFNHHFMLQGRLGNLHTARRPNSRMRHVSVTANFVGGIHDDDAFFLGENSGSFAQHSCFTNSGFA